MFSTIHDSWQVVENIVEKWGFSLNAMVHHPSQQQLIIHPFKKIISLWMNDLIKCEWITLLAHHHPLQKRAAIVGRRSTRSCELSKNHKTINVD